MNIKLVAKFISFKEYSNGFTVQCFYVFVEICGKKNKKDSWEFWPIRGKIEFILKTKSVRHSTIEQNIYYIAASLLDEKQEWK